MPMTEDSDVKNGAESRELAAENFGGFEKSLGDIFDDDSGVSCSGGGWREVGIGI